MSPSRPPGGPVPSACEGRALQNEHNPRSPFAMFWCLEAGHRPHPRARAGGIHNGVDHPGVTFRHVCHPELNKLI